MQKGKRRLLTGQVVSDKMDKTRVISVQRITRHPLYGKIIRSNKKYKIHDEQNESRQGDVVKAIESKPYSKDKTWRLVEVVEKSKF